MAKKFDFLTSNRFWALVIGAFAIYGQSKGWLGESERNLLATIAAGFIAVKTADRASEQKVLAAAVTSGEVSAESATGIPPEK